MVRRRGSSSSIVPLLIFLMFVIGGITAVYVAIDRKIIENPFRTILDTLKGEPVKEPSDIPETPSTVPSVENEFFATTNKPKYGTMPLLGMSDSDFTSGEYFKCKTNPPESRAGSASIFRYIDNLTVETYLNSQVLTMEHPTAPSNPSTIIRNCQGLNSNKFVYRVNYKPGSTVKCTANDPKNSPTTALYNYIGNGKLKHYPDVDTWKAWAYNIPIQTIDDCNYYTLKKDYVPHTDSPSTDYSWEVRYDDGNRWVWDIDWGDAAYWDSLSVKDDDNQHIIYEKGPNLKNHYKATNSDIGGTDEQKTYDIKKGTRHAAYDVNCGQLDQEECSITDWRCRWDPRTSTCRPPSELACDYASCRD